MKIKKLKNKLKSFNKSTKIQVFVGTVNNCCIVLNLDSVSINGNICQLNTSDIESDYAFIEAFNHQP